MPCRDHSCRNPALNQCWKLEQTQRVRDLRARACDALRQLGVGTAEVLEELLVRGSLLQWVELDTVKVLQQGVS